MFFIRKSKLQNRRKVPDEWPVSKSESICVGPPLLCPSTIFLLAFIISWRNKYRWPHFVPMIIDQAPFSLCWILAFLIRKYYTSHHITTIWYRVILQLVVMSIWHQNNFIQIFSFVFKTKVKPSENFLITFRLCCFSFNSFNNHQSVFVSILVCMRAPFTKLDFVATKLTLYVR